ncbi:MAG: hypothetical protein JXC32_06655 [Anaerolineae bacterium]|nr:hypothetical protein [Anaerolineae bacterium]
MAKYTVVGSFAHRALKVLLVVLVVLTAAQAVLAYAARDSVSVPPYIVDLVDYYVEDIGGVPTATAVYAITIDPTQFGDNDPGLDYAISHVGFGISAGCVIAEPEDGVVFTSLTSYTMHESGEQVCGAGNAYSCYADPWMVELGNQIKFECDSDDCLKDKGNTLLFKMMVSNVTQPDPAPDNMSFEIKIGEGTSGQATTTGQIDGPICTPTAVRLSAVNAQSGHAGQLAALGLFVAATIATGTVLRKLPKEN